jgi:hypothetical protein
MKPRVVIHNHFSKPARDAASEEKYKGYTLKQEYPGALVDIYNANGRKIGSTSKANAKSHVDGAIKAMEALLQKRK